MNAIALFLMLVLNGNMTCGAEPPDQVMFGGQAVQVQVYDCYWSERETASHQFVVISPVCPNYIAQPMLLKETHANKGWVMNRFGEFYPSTLNIEMMEVYRLGLLAEDVRSISRFSDSHRSPFPPVVCFAQKNLKLGIPLGVHVVQNPLYFFRFNNNLRPLKDSEITLTTG